MSLNIRSVCENDIDAVVRLSLLAWEPVFESMRRVLGPTIFTAIWPDWRTSQSAGIAGVCRESGATQTWVAELEGTVVGFLTYKLDAGDRTG